MCNSPVMHIPSVSSLRRAYWSTHQSRMSAGGVTPSGSDSEISCTSTAGAPRKRTVSLCMYTATPTAQHRGLSAGACALRALRAGAAASAAVCFGMVCAVGLRGVRGGGSKLRIVDCGGGCVRAREWWGLDRQRAGGRKGGIGREREGETKRKGEREGERGGGAPQAHASAGPQADDRIRSVRARAKNCED
jgi:hypothetical protein